MMAFPQYLQTLLSGKSFSMSHAELIMDQMMRGELTPSQIGALLVALREKGESISELAGFAKSMRKHAVQIPVPADTVDTCGTGGDGGKTFNVSTAAAIVAAAAGVPIAKHGNRGVSSRSGSADVLQCLGVRVDLSPKVAEKMIEKVGLCFLYAPSYHPSMKHVMSIRKELGIRTVFNLLGPLVNPAGVTRQLLGVFDPEWTRPLAEVLAQLGVQRALVVASRDGLDELSVSAPTKVSELVDGKVRDYEIEPADFGIKPVTLAEVAGGDPAYNAKLIHTIFSGEKGAPHELVALNAGAAIYVAGVSDSLLDGYLYAKELLLSGKAEQKLKEITSFSEGMQYVS